MKEFIAVIFSFLLIPLLVKKKIHIGLAMLFCGLLMALISGMGFDQFLVNIQNIFLDSKKIQHYIVIVEVGALGVLLQRYDFVNRIIESLSKLINNKKAIIMIIPALIGFLVVPGGAAMSAPFVDEVGKDLGIIKEERAIINLIYRHIAMHIMPYSTGLVLISALVPEISIYQVIRYNLLFVLIYILIGYSIYIRHIEVTEKSLAERDLSTIGELLKYTAPIYVAIVLNLFLKIPFYIGLLINIAFVFWIHPDKKFLIHLKDAFNFKVLIMVVGVFFIQEIMSDMNRLNSQILFLFNKPNMVIMGMISISLFFGFTTGFQPTSIGVMIPIIHSLNLSLAQLTLYCHFVSIWGFLGYFFSPLHLCQLLTCEYMGVSNNKLYKKYTRFVIILFLVTFIETIFLGKIVD